MRMTNLILCLIVISVLILMFVAQDANGLSRRKKRLIAKKIALALLMKTKKKFIFTLPLLLPVPLPIFKKTQPIIYKQKVPVPVEKPVPMPMPEEPTIIEAHLEEPEKVVHEEDEMYGHHEDSSTWALHEPSYGIIGDVKNKKKKA